MLETRTAGDRVKNDEMYTIWPCVRSHKIIN